MNSRGFTLLEVMVAMTIFAIASMALMQATATQTATLSTLESRTFARWVAENQLALATLEQRWPQESWVNGESDMAGQRWYWRWQGVKTGDENLRAMDVEVRWVKTQRDAGAMLRGYYVRHHSREQ